MLTASEQKQIQQILAAYAPIREKVCKDAPRKRQNAPQPRTAPMRRIPWRKRITDVKHIHEMILRELTGDA
jgi:hypothetical protein